MTEPLHGERRTIFHVSTVQRPDFKHPLALNVFDARGQRVLRAEVRDGKVELPLSAQDISHTRVFVAPIDAKIDTQEVTAAQLERLGAYEPVLQPGGRLIDRIEVPGTIIDVWPFYGTLTGYSEADNAAFALATPCPDCGGENNT
jgi:hypothetical protein